MDSSPTLTEEALQLINHAIDVQGRTASLIDTKAVVLIRSNQPGQAIEVLKDAQSLDKRNANVALHLAWAYQSGGKTVEARKAFREAEKLGWKLAGSDPLERSFMEKLRSELGQ